MKKYIFYVIFFVPFISQAQSNDCIRNGIISTDPDPKYTRNQERPSMKNTFDWRDTAWQVYHPMVFAFQENGEPRNIASPFYTHFKSLIMINFAGLDRQKSQEPQYLDFHPQDGWELLYKNNGVDLEGNPLSIALNRPGPLIVLYNRYTGKIRVLAALSTDVSTYLLTTLKFEEKNNLKVSGLLGKYSGTIRALDQISIVTKAIQPSVGVLANQFFVSEFNTNYDPCTCRNKSELRIKFSKQNLAKLEAKGRLVGTSVPLDASGKSPLLNSKDFLTAVYTDPFNQAEIGSITYQNINKLVKRYEQPSLDRPSQIFASAVKAALPIAGQALGKKLGEVIAKPANKFLTKLLIDTIPKDDIIKAFGELGKNAKQLSGVLFPSQPVVPNISFIEAELALSGKIKEEIEIGSASQLIVTPGSKDSNDATITPDHFYPLYNEALGVFALLETPKVEYHYIKKYVGPWPGLFHNTIRLDQNSIKYYFNPAAEVNSDKTKIYAALVINSDCCDRAGSCIFPKELTLNRVSEGTFITDFYPLEYLTRITFDVYGNNTFLLPCRRSASVSLRLQIFYESNPNRYGKIIKSYEILDFATELVELSRESIRSYLPAPLPENITIYGLNNSTLRTSAGNFNMTWNPTLKALNNIIIAGNLQGLTSSTKLNLMAGNSVIVNNNVTIGNNVTFETKTFDNAYDIPKIQPVPASYVKSFCASSSYNAGEYPRTLARVSRKANKNADDSLAAEPAPVSRSVQKDSVKVEQVSPPSQAEDYSLSKVNIYPNPSTGLIHIALDFVVAQDVEIVVHSALGVQVYEASLQNVKEVIHDLDLRGQVSGMYLVGIIGTQDRFREQVWIE